MDYKEKYEQAMLRMNKWVEGSEIVDPKEVAEFVFPELNESEDERTMRELIRDIDIAMPLDTAQKYIAWIKKQNKQNLANKVESKFNVGDWIVRNYSNKHYKCVNRIVQVKKLNDETFGYTLDDNTYFSGLFENYYHLWTIEDAKDGDVLCCENGWTCIFKSLNNNSFASYCFIDHNKWFCELGGECHSLSEKLCGKIHPAIKEQRELLFQKMKEAGYEWDDEKKELKQIDARKNLILDGDLMQADCMIVEQNPAWSEDDEEFFRSSRCYLNEFGNWLESKNKEKSLSVYKACYWLKSIKKRMKGE